MSFPHLADAPAEGVIAVTPSLPLRRYARYLAQILFAVVAEQAPLPTAPSPTLRRHLPHAVQPEPLFAPVAVADTRQPVQRVVHAFLSPRCWQNWTVMTAKELTLAGDWLTRSGLFGQSLNIELLPGKMVIWAEQGVMLA
nr:SymE family type I addiction module toxin [Brenneria roseae]